MLYKNIFLFFNFRAKKKVIKQITMTNATSNFSLDENNCNAFESKKTLDNGAND